MYAIIKFISTKVITLGGFNLCLNIFTTVIFITDPKNRKTSRRMLPDGLLPRVRKRFGRNSEGSDSGTT